MSDEKRNIRIFRIREDLDPPTRKLIIASIQKLLTSTISYAYFVARQLHRKGIHGNVVSSIDPLPDGFRIMVEYHLVTVDEEVLQKFRGQLYMTAYDYQGAKRIMRKVQRFIEEGEGEVIEEVTEGGGGAKAGGAAEASPSPPQEGGEEEPDNRGSDTLSII